MRQTPRLSYFFTTMKITTTQKTERKFTLTNSDLRSIVLEKGWVPKEWDHWSLKVKEDSNGMELIVVAEEIKLLP